MLALAIFAPRKVRRRPAIPGAVAAPEPDDAPAPVIRKVLISERAIAVRDEPLAASGAMRVPGLAAEPAAATEPLHEAASVANAPEPLDEGWFARVERAGYDVAMRGALIERLGLGGGDAGDAATLGAAWRDEPEERLRVAALRAIGTGGYAEAEPALLEALTSTSPAERAAAIGALDALGARDGLLSALDDALPVLATLAALAIARHDGTDVETVLDGVPRHAARIRASLGAAAI